MYNGRPESQQRFGGGGPDVAEHGEELRAPGGIVVVTAMATETGGDGGVDETVFCGGKLKRIKNKFQLGSFQRLMFFFHLFLPNLSYRKIKFNLLEIYLDNFFIFVCRDEARCRTRDNGRALARREQNTPFSSHN